MILLTGGSGYIGSAIAEHLRQRGLEVDTPPSHRLNVLDDSGVAGYCRGRKYDALIMAHGGWYGHVGKVKDTPLLLWQRAIELNTFGCYSVLNHAQVAGPVIVFGGARGGLAPFPERSAYAASKAALNALVITAAAEGYRIFGVAPGPQPSKHVTWLLEHSGASAATKDEMRASLERSAGIEKVLQIVDDLLAGYGEPGKFYSARFGGGPRADNNKNKERPDAKPRGSTRLAAAA